MTRNEYMKELEIKLSFLPEQTKRAALNFCEEMLDDRMEDGLDEEAAVAAMESPQQIADRMLAEAGDNIDTGKLRLPNRDEYLQFARLADEALQGVDRALEDADRQPAREEEPEAPAEEPESEEKPAPDARPDLPDVGAIVRDALEAARQGIEAGQQAVRDAMNSVMTERDGEQEGEFQKKIFTCSADALRGVSLTCDNMPVRVVACEGNTATLTYFTSEAAPYAASVKDGVLILEGPGKGRGFSFSLIGSGLKMLINRTFPTVELALPADALVDLAVHTSNGSVKAQGLSALCQVGITTSNSRIDFQRIICKSMDLKTSNARIELERTEAKTFLKAKASNDRIECRDVRCGGEMTLRTSNGHITLENARAAARLEAVSSNGSIQAEGVDSRDVMLKTSNASIKGTLAGRQADYAIDSGTSNGSNSLPNAQSGEKRLSVHTSNGSIRVGFEG